MNSHAQCGEDGIVRHFLGSGAKSYVDIGAHDPVALSNTYHFWQTGGNGVLVEPLPARCEALRRLRPRDLVLECAAGGLGKKTLYLFQPDVLASFLPYWSEAAASTLEVDVRPLAEILALLPNCDFLSVDVEGFEIPVLESNDWDRYRPKIVIVETKIHKENSRTEVETTAYMTSKGYVVLADTYINTLYSLPEIRR